MAGSVRRVLARVPDPPDENDYQWRALVIREAVPVPASYKLGSLGPVLDQGQTPECVAYTAKTVKLHSEYVQHRRYYNFQPDWLYAECKKIDGDPTGEGTYYRAACKVMASKGYWAHVLHPGTNPWYEERYYKIGSYVRLSSLQEIKEAVYVTKGVVALGIDIDSGWWDPPANGQIPEPNHDIEGGHEIAVCGWNSTSLVIKNSWSEYWGAGGYAYLPYSHLSTYSDWDAWKTMDDPTVGSW